ncbi:hypothetical protein BDM02DRAFT_1522771 [Thelephora ganbajun]|uniref:Uncharacterized protein n=1 Tax=Thelephora ganbajun TaxID=370292 RepID=A0ACB6ZKQ6_THEGA|nr:hypothetical protein BDM02DRAFT_1522771 [Thelephora ganbajun]
MFYQPALQHSLPRYLCQFQRCSVVLTPSVNSRDHPPHYRFQHEGARGHHHHGQCRLRCPPHYLRCLCSVPPRSTSTRPGWQVWVPNPRCHFDQLHQLWSRRSYSSFPYVSLPRHLATTAFNVMIVKDSGRQTLRWALNRLSSSFTPRSSSLVFAHASLMPKRRLGPSLMRTYRRYSLEGLISSVESKTDARRNEILWICKIVVVGPCRRGNYSGLIQMTDDDNSREARS